LPQKKFLTYEQQIRYLISEKNLVIQDINSAKQILFKVGYFPLINGYKKIFKNSVTQKFKDGTCLKNLYDLYSFDNELRTIFLKNILITERNIKSSLSYHFSEVFGGGQSDYLNSLNYDYAGLKIPLIKTLIKIMSGQLRKDSHYAYIHHYLKVYQDVPLWVLINVMTFGQMSKLYACQKGQIKIRVCNDFGKIKINEFEKMIAVSTKFRNVCAHNERLFDFRTKDALLDMNIHKRLHLQRKKDRYQCGKHDLFAVVIILKLLLSDEDFRTFYGELKRCFERYPIYKQVLGEMGFPKDWYRIRRIKKFLKNEKV